MEFLSLYEHEADIDETRKCQTSKLLTELNRFARKRTAPGECILCGKKITGACRSHSIPQFVLRNIAVDGKVITVEKVYRNSLSKGEAGVRQTGLFYNICRDCDSKRFSEYENLDAYFGKPTDVMMNQISVKNGLKSLCTHEMNIQRLQKFSSCGVRGSVEDYICLDEQIRINRLDAEDDRRNINLLLNPRGKKEQFNLFYYTILDYVAPIAFQGEIFLIADLRGNLVNDIWNHELRYRPEPLSICIFPLKDKTAVFAFTRYNAKRYSRFITQFNKLGEKDKLAVLYYIVILYSEDWAMSKNIDERIFSEQFREVVGKTSYAECYQGEQLDYALLFKEYDLRHYKTLPSLLGREYAII